MDLDKLKFDERGLIPAIVVDAENKKVLTLAYMNRESLEISMREGRTCFWSRSRRAVSYTHLTWTTDLSEYLTRAWAGSPPCACCARCCPGRT